MYKGNFRRDGFHQFIITCIPGDLNYDSLIDILDVVIIVQYIIGSVDELECGDINGDTITDILDIISLLNSILDN